VRRDQLVEPAAFLATVLHELEHAASGCDDGALEFEEALTHRLGVTASVAIDGNAQGRRTA
jgi:hypothetical protein